jgi:hypothetical protein
MSGRTDWLTGEALLDVLHGATILGVGGGGPFLLGQALVQEVLALGPPAVVDPRDVPDGAAMAVSACAGAPASSGLSGPSPAAAAGGQANDGSPGDAAARAYEELERRRGVRFSHVLPAEIGAENSFVPMLVAARRRLPLVDADGARRAVATLGMTTYAGKVPVSPIVLAAGRTVVGFSAADAQEADRTMRDLLSRGAFENFAGIALWAMSGASMKSAALWGTLSYARDLGKALRQAKEKRQDPVAAVCAFLQGRVLFRGTLTHDVRQIPGFEVGRVTLVSADRRSSCTVYSQNENAIAWSDQAGRPLGMGPDLLCWLTAGGQPFSNAAPDLDQLATGEVVLIGAPSPPASRTPAIVAEHLAVLRRLGYGGPYIPLESLA